MRRPSPADPIPHLGEPLLDARAVAGFLGVDRSTVFRLAGRELPVVEIGRAKRFRPKDVLAFVEHATRATRSAPGRAKRLLRPLPARPRNGLATSREQSVHVPKQESSGGSDTRHKEAAR